MKNTAQVSHYKSSAIELHGPINRGSKLLKGLAIVGLRGPSIYIYLQVYVQKGQVKDKAGVLCLMEHQTFLLCHVGGPI